jgi:hypothetical protein
LNGGKAPPAAAAVGYGAATDGEVHWLMESSADELAQQQDVAAETQLALAELRSEASVGVGAGRASFGARMFGQQGSQSAASSSYKASEGLIRASGDADGLDLDDADGPGSSSSAEVSWAADYAGQSQPSSMPSSPKRAGAGAANFGSSSSSGQQQQQQQQPGSPSGRASLAVSRSSSSRRGSVAADGGGGVYSVLSELDLSQNPLGATGAKVVAEVRKCSCLNCSSACAATNGCA